MSDGYEHLARTVREVEELRSEAGLDRASVFNLRDLSFHSSIPEADIRRLLDGELVEAPRSAAAELARRIVFLRETRLTVDKHTGGRRQYTTAEIAAGSGMTPQWHGKLLNHSTPNIWHGAHFAKFFDVPMEYFTQTPHGGRETGSGQQGRPEPHGAPQESFRGRAKPSRHASPAPSRRQGAVPEPGDGFDGLHGRDHTRRLRTLGSGPDAVDDLVFGHGQQ